MSNQMLLAIAGLFLLSIITLTYNRSISGQQTTMINNEAILTATALAQGMIDEISTRAYDEKTKTSGVTVADSLTTSGSLGPDSGESSVSLFDDIDDFNNYTKTSGLQRLGNFAFKVNVYYVQNLLPDTKIFTRSFSKRIDVAVYNQYLPDTLKLKTIISY
jgi:hypothetical protein